VILRTDRRKLVKAGAAFRFFERPVLHRLAVLTEEQVRRGKSLTGVKFPIAPFGSPDGSGLP
jgi:hypothetical protein